MLSNYAEMTGKLFSFFHKSYKINNLNNLPNINLRLTRLVLTTIFTCLIFVPELLSENSMSPKTFHNAKVWKAGAEKILKCFSYTSLELRHLFLIPIVSTDDTSSF